jgi:uncharacterized phiE125 gp8 family phage protein
MADLTTLPNVKAWLEISGNSDDPLLSRLITAVSASVLRYLSRDILQATYALTINGTGRDRWMFPQYPVTAVSSVSIDGTTISASTGIAAAGYVFDESTLYLRGYRLTCGVQNVTISFTAGYTETPVDIEQACIDWISLLYKGRKRIGEQSKVIGGEQVNYFTGPMPKSCELMLAPRRNVVPR